MAQGLIVLGVLTFLVALIFARGARRLGLPVRTSTAVSLSIAVALLVLVMYALAASGH